MLTIASVVDIDTVATQNEKWLLAAGLFVLATVVLYIWRQFLKSNLEVKERYLKESLEMKADLKNITEKHIAGFERSATAMSESAYKVADLARQVVDGLKESTETIKRNTQELARMRHLQERTAIDIQREADRNREYMLARGHKE
jgi:hypothetical protein